MWSPDILTLNTSLIERFESQWQFARGLTTDLLKSLDARELAFTPGIQLGPFWKHFRHLGRVQENYLQALEAGKIAFGFEGTTYGGDASREQLLGYLQAVDRRLEKTLSTLDVTRQIDWFGTSVDAYTHFSRLADHETLHQGMFVVYIRLLKRSFPPNWAAWGL